jgi:tRNA-dihydrouridine synthase B
MTWFDKKPIIALAPMADFTDGPFCQICREVSGKDFVIFREMVSAEAIVRDNEKTLKMCEFKESERLIVVQIFGSKPQTMRRAAEIVSGKFRPDGIDINMGCPVPKITGKNMAGSALMKDVDLACEIVEAVKAPNLGIPISVKTRLGWSREDEILEFAPRLESAGADLLSIHGRTKLQGYTGKANWEMIGRVKKLVKIPIVANGDIVSTENVDTCFKITGADGVMIGRGALGNPWIFKGQTPNLDELFKVVLRHAELYSKYYGEERGLSAFRKHLLWYFKGARAAGIPDLKKIRATLVRIETLEELTSFFSALSSSSAV